MVPRGWKLLAVPLVSAAVSSAFLVPTFTPQQSARYQASRRFSAQRTVMMSGDWALLFDCDGVLADTERDGHRPAFNQAFQEKGIKSVWDVELYGRLLKIGGGKERMTAYWNEVGWPEGYADEASRKALVQDLHLLKTKIFMDMIEAGKIPLRPGVLRVVDDAIKAGIKLGVCSTSNDKAVSTLVRVLMGPERYSKFQIFAGDVVAKKKPSPDIYNLAKDTMGLDPTRTVVVEDSEIGLAAAKAAGMRCLVTKSSYTANEDFHNADRIVEELGDAASPAKVAFDDLKRIALGQAA